MNEVLGGKEWQSLKPEKKGEKRELSKITRKTKVGYEIRNSENYLRNKEKIRPRGKKMCISQKVTNLTT